MFTILGVQVTLLQLIAAIPVIIKIIRDGSELVELLMKNGASFEDASKQALDLVLKKIGEVFEGFGVPHPRPMTPEEEQIWFDRATGEH